MKPKREQINIRITPTDRRYIAQIIEYMKRDGQEDATITGAIQLALRRTAFEFWMQSEPEEAQEE